MRLAVDGASWAVAPALTLSPERVPGDLPAPATLAAAIRGDGGEPVTYEGPEPGPVRAYVGVRPRPLADDQLRAALAAAARSRGHEAPQRERIDDLERELAECSLPSVDLASARERVAETGADLERQRERVARLQGRAQETDDEAVAEELADAVAALSEAETEHVAAEQALAAARERAREARDVRERRLKLADDRDNLRRAARATLAAEVAPDVRRALRKRPGTATLAVDPPRVEGDRRAVALAVLAVADVAAPVVLAGGRFDSAAAAATALEAPVVRYPPCES